MKLHKLRSRVISFLTVLAIIASLFGVMPITASAEVTFDGGSGTESEPYQIISLATLENFRDSVNKGETYEGDYIKLTADIDMSEKYSAATGMSWTPIGTQSNPFNGTFDGDIHKITGLYINAPSNNYQGLFGNIGEGTVKNLGVDGTVTGKARVGGIAGYNGTVQNCYNMGTITGTGDNVGGIVGYNGTVQNCYNTGAVSGGGNVGGLVGWNSGKTVQNCYNTGAVTGTGDNVGGAVGYTWKGVTNCYSVGTVTGAGGYAGGVVGYNNGGTVTSCYYLNTCGAAGSNGTSKTTAELAAQGTFVGWNFTDIWKMSSALGRPIFTAISEPEPHKHKVCNDASCADGHEDITWTAWERTDTIPQTEGNYYLTKDVTMEYGAEISGNTKICLNGHTITQNGNVSAITVSTNGTLDLCDCSANRTGKVTDGESCTYGKLVTVAGTFNLYSGNITGGKDCGISTSTSGGIINMYGGKVSDNKNSGVLTYADSAAFNMYGGEISGNSGQSGGVYVFKGSFNMQGGKITGNEATNYGGGVNVSDTAGAVVIKGEISGNSSNWYGGGVCAMSPIKIIDAKITGNRAQYGGGAVHFLGDGIYPIITVGGKTVISGNTNADGTAASNFMVFDAEKIDVDDDAQLSDGADIGITYYFMDSSRSPFSITDTTNKDDFSAYFKSDNENYIIKNADNNVLKLIVKPSHSLVHHAAVAATCTTAGTGEYWKCEGENGCNKMFSDKDGKTEINEIPTIAANGHKYGSWEFKLTDNSTEVIRTCENDSSHQEKRNAEIQLVLQHDECIYNGQAHKPKATVKVQIDGEWVTLTENTDYTLSYENNTNASTDTAKAKVTIKGKGDYSGTAERAFTIAQKPLTVTGATATSRAYDGTTAVEVTAAALSGVCGEDTVAVDTDNLTGTVSKADVGNYEQVTLQNLELVNNDNGNYVLSQANVNVPANVSITKADAPAGGDTTHLNIANSLEKEYTYLLSRLCPQINEEGAAIQKDWGERSYEVKIEFTKGGYYDEGTARIDKAENPEASGGEVKNTLYLPIKFKDTTDEGVVGTVTVTVKSKNYNDFERTFNIAASNKKAVTFGGITAMNNVFNDSAWKGYTGDLTITDSDGNAVELTPEILYSGRMNTAYSERAEAPTNAGTYSVIFRVPDTNATYIGKNTFDFEITKASGSGSVTMADFEFGKEPSTPVPQSATNGTEGVTYQYKAKDADDSEYKSEKPTAVGEYTVKAIFPEAQNYAAAEATANFKIDHSYKTEWSHDASNHWHDCVQGDSKTDVAAHTWDNGTVTQVATCTLEGRTRYSCTACGREKVETTAPLGHDWGNWTITKAPTLTETGTAEHVCKRNGEHKDIKALPTLTDTTVWMAGTRVEPTETTDGTQEFISEYGTITVKIPKLTPIPSSTPSAEPSASPSVAPSASPSVAPSASPSVAPSASPSVAPSASPYYGGSYRGNSGYSTEPSGTVTPTPKPGTESTASPNGISEPEDNAKQHKAYIMGYGGRFMPNGDITRAEAAAILARLTDGFDESADYAAPFMDVNSAEWYANYIGFEQGRNIITGYVDGTFRPENSITRAEFATMIAKFAGLTDSTAAAEYADISGHWAQSQIAACHNAGYIEGYEDNTFRPESNITRAEAVAIINRVLDRHDIKNFTNPFDDVSEAHWAYIDIMEAAITHDI